MQLIYEYLLEVLEVLTIQKSLYNMKEQDYNNFITTLSNRLAPINQLLYEILVIITIYIYLERILSNSLYLSKYSSSVVIIFIILALSIDLFIWQNPIQTFLFGAILVIYLRYNMNNMQLISSFINMTGEHIDAANFEQSSESTIRECQIPRIPEMVDLPYDTSNIKPYGIMAYDKTETSISAIHDAYKSDQPLATITDSSYAEIMLNELYHTSQYRNNNPPNEIDSSLSNDVYKTKINNNVDSNVMGDKELLDSFQHPKRQFLDSRWLSMKGIGTYNDNSLCNTTNCNQNKNKDAICSVATFGKKLEQCTNQDFSVSIGQLDEISNNEILHDKF